MNKTIQHAGALLILVALTTGLHGQSTNESLLTILITSPTGSPISGARISIHAEDGSLVYSGHETKLRLRYGKYVMNVTGEFLKSVSRRVEIDRPEAFIVLAPDMAESVLDLKNEPVSISLRIHPSDTCTPAGFLWAKLVGVFSDYMAETQVSRSGFALFESLAPGKYLIMIIDGQKVRTVQPITTKGTISLIDVPLAQCE